MDDSVTERRGVCSGPNLGRVGPATNLDLPVRFLPLAVEMCRAQVQLDSQSSRQRHVGPIRL